MRVRRGSAGAPGLPAPFNRLVSAWAGSLTGDGLRVIALPLLAVSVNSSAAAVAAVAVASTLPWLLVAIPAGALVDRLDPDAVVDTALVDLPAGSSAAFHVRTRGTFDPAALTRAPVLRSANDVVLPRLGARDLTQSTA